MGHYSLTYFHPDHLQEMEMNLEAVWTFQHVPLPHGGDAPPSSECPAYTMWRKGKPLGSFGAVMDSPTSGDLWAILSRHAQRYPVGLVRGMWQFLWHCNYYYGLTHLTAHVRAESYRAKLLCEWLGMKEAELLPQYLAGTDFVRYLWRP